MGDIQAHFVHGPDGAGMHPDGVDSSTVQGDGIPAVESREGFRHLAAGRVAGAEEKYRWFFSHS